MSCPATNAGEATAAFEAAAVTLQPAMAALAQSFQEVSNAMLPLVRVFVEFAEQNPEILQQIQQEEADRQWSLDEDEI